MSCLLPTVVWSLLLVSLAQAGHAQDESAADAAFERGAAHYAARELEQAASAFEKSYRLAPAPNVAFNIAQIYELLGREEDAYNWWREHASFEPGGLNAAQREHVDTRLAALSRRVAVVEVVTHPAAARLAIDGVPMSWSGDPRRIALPPGRHVVVAELEGHASAEAAVDLERGAVTPLTLRPAALDLAAVEAVSPPEKAPAEASVPKPVLRLAPAEPARAERAKERGLGPVRWVGYGTAAALLAVGVTSGVMALDTRGRVQADPTREGKDQLAQQNLIADLTIGGALLTAATTLVLDLVLESEPPAEPDVRR